MQIARAYRKKSTGLPQRDVTRWLPLMLILLSMWVLSGCVVTPIEAQDGSSPDGNSAATIAIAPVSGVPGDTIFVSGAGWASNESVYINLEQVPDEEPIQTTVAVATSDGEGRFTLTFAYPVDPIWREPGVIDVVAYSLENGAQAIAPFEVLESPPPTAVTPTTQPTAAQTATSVSPVATATASGSGQPRPTATRTPTPRPQNQNIGVVVSSALNIRTGPSTAFTIVRAISRGTEFTVLGQNNSGAWLLVRLSGGAEGWLARAYTNYTALAPVVPSPKPPVATAAPTPGPTSTRPPQGSGWRGEFYNNRNLTGQPKLVRSDANIDFDWGQGSPAAGVNNDDFSVRWVRSFFLSSGSYRFYATADDGVRVWVNGELIIDEWHASSGQTYSVVKQVDSGSALVRVEYYEAKQTAKVRFWWETATTTYSDWRGEYYPNIDLRGTSAFVRNDQSIDFNWGNGSPANNFPSDRFSVRWTRDQHFDAGTYRFHATMDDGMRVYLDDNLIIDEFRNGSSREVTRDIYVNQGVRRLRVEYYEDTQQAVARFWWERISDSDDPDDFPDWKGEYWDNRGLDGDPDVVRNDDEIDFNWGGGSPDSRIDDDNFSARWTRWVDFDDARYRFHAVADDGVRVWVGDDRIINEWHDNSSSQTYSAEIDLDGDERVRVEYYERTGGARVEVWWEKVGSSPTATPTDEQINPYADVSPSQGGGGTGVTVVGGGFPANTTVNVYLGGVVSASAADAADAEVRASTTTDRDGNYSVTFTMPNTWPDGDEIEPGNLVILVATPDFSVEASAVFEYQGTPATPPPSSDDPYAQLSPSTGGAGTRVTISGGGFPANTRVRVYLAGVVSARSLDANPEDYASGDTNGEGSYSLSFNMPSEWPNGEDIETGKLIVLVATDNFNVEASADFDYFVDAPNASVEVSPRSGGAGTSVQVSGSGFPANTPVSLYLGTLDDQVGGGATERIFANTNTDRRGNYSMVLTMPALWPNGASIPAGRLVIVVANSDFSVVASGSFDYAATGTPVATPTPTNTPDAAATATPAPFANVNPGSGGGGTTVTVNGGGFPADVTVSVYLAIFGGGGGFAADAERYATDATDASGNYSLNFAMPDRWPDGSNIDSGRLLIVVATNDFDTQASASFNYSDAAVSGAVVEATPTATTVPTVAATVVVTATAEPTASVEPTVAVEPTDVPTEAPTEAPTATTEPTATEAPTEVPTEAPTATTEPTATVAPTEAPTEAPTATTEPTATVAPTEVPTEVPTATTEPTATTVPTEAPTAISEPTATVEQADVPEEVPTDTPVPENTATPTPTEVAPVEEVPVEEPTVAQAEAPPVEVVTPTEVPSGEGEGSGETP